MSADPGLSTIAGDRGLLLNLAYRMLGSLSDAEDVVQETYARWYAMTPAEQDAIEIPAAWLTRVASRICLDVLGSARVRRETYVGEWIPEPVPDRTDGDPADRITLDESISMAFLVVLESMTPAERVTFVLHDVFRYSYAEIAQIVGRTPAACRKLASLGRRRIETSHPVPASTAEHARVVKQFKQAWETKDIKALLGLLDPDATAVADGGGHVMARLHPIEGADRIARFYIAIARRATGLRILEQTVNGRPGLVVEHADVTLAVLALDVADGRIRRIWSVRNPEKLRSWTG
jgi:RNA polymerase sigma factor (sigma-70 family)